MARNYAAMFHEYLEEMTELTDEEFGRLMRGLLRYSATGELFQAEGNEKYYVRRVMAQEDRVQESYVTVQEKLAAAGKKGAARRWGDKAATDPNGENGHIKTK